MNTEEITRFHAERTRLFPTHLPQRVVDAITAQVATKRLDRCLSALERYAVEKPYRGFYLARFNHHYDVAIPSLRERESGSREAPLPAPENAAGDWMDSERTEFEAIPAEYVNQCREWFRDWPWKENSRAWRILVVDSYAGKDIERFRCLVHPSKKRSSIEERFRAIQIERERVGWHNLVAQLRAEVVRLGGRADVVEDGLTMVRDRPSGLVGSCDTPTDGRSLGPFRLHSTGTFDPTIPPDRR